jgi:hypothetical protein
MTETLYPKLTKQEYGKLVRKEFLDFIKPEWGNYKSLSGYLYGFKNNKKILTLYSNFLNNDRWWYGVSKEYWSNWDEYTYMALLMRDGMNCDFVMLNPRESEELLNRTDPDLKGQKHINIRMPSVGKVYIQKWQDFPFAQRIVKFGKIEIPNSAEELRQKSAKRVILRKKPDYIASAKAMFSKMSKEERQDFLNELKKL